MTIDFSFHCPSVNESSALPKHFFTDPKIYDLEKDKVFRSDWVAVARVDQLINPGDYLTYDFFGDPIILACNKQGQINAFSNVCLHRACPIASGTGNTKTLFTCPYHQWAYDLEGRFRGAPDMEQAVNFNRDMRLPSLQENSGRAGFSSTHRRTLNHWHRLFLSWRPSLPPGTLRASKRWAF